VITVNCKRAVAFVHVQTLKKENVDRVFYFQVPVVLDRILSNFQSFTCSTIAMNYRTLSFNASVKAVLENKKLDPHFLSSKFEHVQKRQLFAIDSNTHPASIVTLAWIAERFHSNCEENQIFKRMTFFRISYF